MNDFWRVAVFLLILMFLSLLEKEALLGLEKKVLFKFFVV